ncbi:MAG: hypothetical protein QHC88_08010 [Achromobacter sp.]|uniref:hypothetical protein n=1 Tax=unclassified Achromobacter TaxID=2626865 RepID=UPI000E74991E|nr:MULTISPECIES: hypothetical protein [unclassified Achromobacter]AYD66925.1 hypothetical protein DVB37_25655 [Achromobacter sp. B7]MDX3985188.1 hypothetical protein [Achromobacter sp.]
MNVSAISPITRVAAPYPARVPLVDDTRPTFEAERLAREAAVREAALREAQRTKQAQAAWEAQRLARAREASEAARTRPAANTRTDTTAHTDTTAYTGLRAEALAPLAADVLNPDILRDQFADARLRRALDAYAAQSDPVAQRAGNANDLGTIEGLTPLQPYRVAMANPQVELQAAVAVKAAAVAVPAVVNIGATENVTDNARYRSGAAARMS